MNVNVTGVKPVKFEKDNKLVEGWKIYYQYPDPADENLIGMATADIWANKKVVNGLEPQDLLSTEQCNFEFNQKGKIIAVSPIIGGQARTAGF